MSTARNLSRRATDFVSVKDFGAKGDGVTDDTAAIQAAINSGLAVVFPRATYALGSALTIASPVTIYGEGSTLKRTFNTNFIRTLTISGTNVTIRDLRIDGNRSSLTLTEFKGSIAVTGSIVRLENVICVNSVGDGFELSGHDIVMDNCTSDNSYRNGMSVTNGYNVVVSNSSFVNTTGTAPQCGVDVEPDLAANNCYNVHFINCNIASNASHGAQVLLSATPTGTQRDVHFTDCTVASNAGAGINIGRAISTRISNCDIRSNSSSGVLFNNSASDVQILGGQIRLNGIRGISLVVNSTFTVKDTLICGVSIKDNSASSAGSYHGIRAAGPGTVNGVTVMNCRIGNDSTSNQGYAITTDSSVSNLTLLGNNLNGNVFATPLLGDDATTRIANYNEGYVTKNAGVTSAVATGAVISHGLAVTPTVVLLQAQDGTPTNVYPSAIGASSFTINYTGGGTHAFAWEAKTANSL